MDPNFWALRDKGFELSEYSFHGMPGFVLYVDPYFAKRLGWVKSKEFADFVDAELANRNLCKVGYRIESEQVAPEAYVLAGVCK
jgi:hypothetical protein